MFLKSFQQLREKILRDESTPKVVLDLGFNVLDGATARWAAFTLKKETVPRLAKPAGHFLSLNPPGSGMKNGSSLKKHWPS